MQSHSTQANLTVQPNVTFNYTGSLQTYTVPPGVTSIKIVAAGAQGGSVSVSCAATGGLGARMEGDFSVTPGENLSILVGQQGLTNGADAGGGGGTFVVRTGNVPLIVAGGGGGATNNIGNCGGNRDGLNATVTTSGTASGNGLVAGGINGNGGGASSGSGGGGGGFLTNGTAGTGLAGNNGKSYLNGGAGGTGNNNDFGGYGGGGAGWFTGGNGGGGGGYSGGGTSGSLPFTGGGSGGSYNVGTNQVNTAGFQTGNGFVTITELVVCPTVTVTNPATAQGGLGASFNQTFTATGGTAPYMFTLGSGTLPTGLTLSTGGVLAGTPTQTGAFPITVTATDNNGCSGTGATYNLVIASVQAGRIFVADTYNNRVQRFEAGSWTVLNTPALVLPEAVTASLDGMRIYVADTNNNKVIYSTDGGGTWADFATAGLVGPQGLALDFSGHVFVANTGANQVLRYDENTPLGTPLVLAAGGTGTGQVMEPRGLAFDLANRLFIADRGNSRILRIPTANGSPGATFQVAGRGVGAAPFGQVTAPEGLAVDNAGNLYVADTGNNRVIRFASGNNGAATVLCTISSGLTAPPLGQVRGAEGVTITDAGLIGGTAGQPAIVVSDTQNQRLQGAYNPAFVPASWQLVGTPNGTGTAPGQFKSPGKIR
ncbi:MAG: putative Ig domain-containing protein [Blastocatellia bacterium]|nr:putative Ig domain-containing protein [Blastocatellia bacterium]